MPRTLAQRFASFWPFRERRDLHSNIRDPEAWLVAAVGAGTKSGQSVTAETACNVSTVYRCVSIIAGNLATLPLKLYRKTATGQEEAREHSLFRILHSEPNQWDTSFSWRFLQQSLVCLRGNAFSRIFRDWRGDVIEIEPLDPTDVEVRGSRDNFGRRQIFYFVRNKPMLPGEILHVYGLPASNGYLGVSPIHLMRESVGIALATEDYAARFFSNDSRPPGILKTDGKLTDDAVSKLRKLWTDAQTEGNRHKVAVLHSGLSYQPIGLSNEDAQFLETRKFATEEIARWFGVPPHLVGATEKSTSWGSGLEEQKANFVTFTMLVWLTNWERALDRALLTEAEKSEGYYCKFSIEGFLRGKSTEQMQNLVAGLQNGIYSINEARSYLELNQLPDAIGGAHRVPVNTAPAGQAAAPEREEVVDQ